MTDWPTYLRDFHRERPGITEALLGRCVGVGGDGPYRWLTRPVAGLAEGSGPVIDLGCGSGPVADDLGGWIGVDVSLAELAGARERGRGPLVAARAEAMPIASGSATLVLAVMALMVVDQPVAVIAEAARMLRLGGKLVVLLPAGEPLSVADRLRYGVLFAALGRSAVPFPHADVQGNVHDLLSHVGFEVIGDDRTRFGYPMRGRPDVDRLIASLYLPGVSSRRLGAARLVAGRWGRTDLGVPLRRVVARWAGPGR